MDEIRPGLSHIYFYAGSRAEEVADRWAEEIAGLLAEHGRGDVRLAVDQIDLIGVRALEKRGVSLVDAWALMEEARVVTWSRSVSLTTSRARLAGIQEATGKPPCSLVLATAGAATKSARLSGGR